MKGPTRKFARLASRRPSPPADPAPARDAPVEPTLACPACGARMVRRLARRGPNQGRYFWGCSEYPKCAATVSEA